MSSSEDTDTSQPTDTSVEDEKTLFMCTDPDMVITLKNPKGKAGTPSIVIFRVKKEVVTSKSEHFKRSLSFNRANGHGSLVLPDEDLSAMRICFLCMHDVPDDYWTDQILRAIDIGTIWELIVAADKYLFEGDLAEAIQQFFAKWYKSNVNLKVMELEAAKKFARQLAFPCHFFDHAVGFAMITKWLAYNFDGHVTELKPVSVKWTHMHLCPPDFVGPVNHARGTLKTCLHKGLWKRVERLLSHSRGQSGCRHWAEAAGHYFAELTNTGAYPLEMTFPRNSVNQLLIFLSSFRMSQVAGCRLCQEDWDRVVQDARMKTADHFQGLCIDCMDRSKIANARTDEYYWTKLGPRAPRDCRVKHGDCTWYVSWCGRDEHRKKLMEAARCDDRMLSRLDRLV